MLVTSPSNLYSLSLQQFVDRSGIDCHIGFNEGIALVHEYLSWGNDRHSYSRLRKITQPEGGYTFALNLNVTRTGMHALAINIPRNRRYDAPFVVTDYSLGQGNVTSFNLPPIDRLWHPSPYIFDEEEGNAFFVLLNHSRYSTDSQIFSCTFPEMAQRRINNLFLSPTFSLFNAKVARKRRMNGGGAHVTELPYNVICGCEIDPINPKTKMPSYFTVYVFRDRIEFTNHDDNNKTSTIIASNWIRQFHPQTPRTFRLAKESENRIFVIDNYNILSIYNPVITTKGAIQSFSLQDAHVGYLEIDHMAVDGNTLATYFHINGANHGCAIWNIAKKNVSCMFFFEPYTVSMPNRGEALHLNARADQWRWTVKKIAVSERERSIALIYSEVQPQSRPRYRLEVYDCGPQISQPPEPEPYVGIRGLLTMARSRRVQPQGK